MLRCTLETQVSRPNTDPDIHGPELGCASAEFQEDEQAHLRSRTAFAISAGGSLDTTLGNSPDKTF